jgi:hypothetical protein
MAAARETSGTSSSLNAGWIGRSWFHVSPTLKKKRCVRAHAWDSGAVIVDERVVPGPIEWSAHQLLLLLRVRAAAESRSQSDARRNRITTGQAVSFTGMDPLPSTDRGEAQRKNFRKKLIGESGRVPAAIGRRPARGQ